MLEIVVLLVQLWTSAHQFLGLGQHFARRRIVLVVATGRNLCVQLCHGLRTQRDIRRGLFTRLVDWLPALVFHNLARDNLVAVGARLVLKIFIHERLIAASGHFALSNQLLLLLQLPHAILVLQLRRLCDHGLRLGQWPYQLHHLLRRATHLDYLHWLVRMRISDDVLDARRLRWHIVHHVLAIARCAGHKVTEHGPHYPCPTEHAAHKAAHVHLLPHETSLNSANKWKACLEFSFLIFLVLFDLFINLFFYIIVDSSMFALRVFSPSSSHLISVLGIDLFIYKISEFALRVFPESFYMENSFDLIAKCCIIVLIVFFLFYFLD